MKKVTVLVATILVVFVAMSTPGLCQEEGVDVCYKRMNGQLRISDSCRPSESSISLVSREEFEALVARVEIIEEALEEAGEIDPCAGIPNCCISDDQCQDGLSYCLEPSKCYGVSAKGVCENNSCIQKTVDDDSVCDGEEALNCDGEVILCTDEVDQDPPACL